MKSGGRGFPTEGAARAKAPRKEKARLVRTVRREGEARQWG